MGLIANVVRNIGRSALVVLSMARRPLLIGKLLRDMLDFRRAGGAITAFVPITRDFQGSAGVMRGHYFHQDLLVASFINERQPLRHIDVGSRIDGFVAHVAAFRRIEILDIREMEDPQHPRIVPLQVDVMDSSIVNSTATDSLSCLHALEHFGLGRYGDKIDPNGHLKGFESLVRMLEPGGFLYISFPIGSQSETVFNAHRVFQPREILEWPLCEESLVLERFDYVDDKGNLRLEADLKVPIPRLKYGCGIYTFKKKAQATRGQTQSTH